MKNLFTLIILFLLTLASYFLLKSLQEEVVQEKNAQEKKIVAVAQGVTMHYFNEKNKLQYKLISPKVIDYSNHHGTDFVSPNLAVFDETLVQTWQGKASEGYLSSDKDNLLLKKGVKIIQTPTGEKPTYIDGKEMNYNAKTSLITSKLPVKIDDGVVVQVSDKLKLDTRSKQLNASDRVKATYKARPKKP